MSLYRIVSRTDTEGFTCVTILRDGETAGYAWDWGASEALKRARMSMYNRALPFRRGADMDRLRKYNARYGLSARSLHG